MRSVLDTLSRAAILIASGCIVAMTVIITYQVVARYVFNDSPAWSERLSLVLLAYLVFFGAAAGVHKKFHIRIEVLRNAVPRRLGKLLEIVAHGAVALAGLVMMIAGFQLTTSLWEFAVPSLGIPRGLALLPLPIAGGLITLFSVAHLVTAAKSSSEKAG